MLRRLIERAVFIHGNQTRHWSFSWAPWLQAQCQTLGMATFFETMPDSIIALAQYWLPFLREHIGLGERDVVMGWSSGAVAAMRYAETQRLGGAVLVSPCHTDLGDELEKTSGYYDQPWQWEAIRSNVAHGPIQLLSGTDDPFIPQQEFAHIAEQLQARWTQVPQAGHFIERVEFAEGLAALRQVMEPG